MRAPVVLALLAGLGGCGSSALESGPAPAVPGETAQAGPPSVRGAVRIGTVMALRSGAAVAEADSEDGDDDDDSERWRPHVARVPVVVPGTPTASNGFSAAVIQKVIRSRMAQLTACYQRQLAGQPTLNGTVRTTFTIDPSGAVTYARAAGMPVVASCVEGVLKTMRFPAPPGGGSVTVTYPFIFRPDGPAAAPGPGSGPLPDGERAGEPSVPPARVRCEPADLPEPVRLAKPGLDDCYETQLQREPGLAGVMIAVVRRGQGRAARPEVGKASAEYQTALARADVARKMLARTRALASEGLITARELQEAEAQATTAEAEVKVALAALRSFGPAESTGDAPTVSLEGLEHPALRACVTDRLRGVTPPADADLAFSIGFATDSVPDGHTEITVGEHTMHVGMMLRRRFMRDWHRPAGRAAEFVDKVARELGKDGRVILRGDDGAPAQGVARAAERFRQAGLPVVLARRRDESWQQVAVQPVRDPWPTVCPSGFQPDAERPMAVSVMLAEDGIWVGTGDQPVVVVRHKRGQPDLLGYARLLRDLRRSDLRGRADAEIAAERGVPWADLVRAVAILHDNGFFELRLVATPDYDPRRD